MGNRVVTGAIDTANDIENFVDDAKNDLNDAVHYPTDQMSQLGAQNDALNEQVEEMAVLLKEKLDDAIRQANNALIDKLIKEAMDTIETDIAEAKSRFHEDAVPPNVVSTIILSAHANTPTEETIRDLKQSAWYGHEKSDVIQDLDTKRGLLEQVMECRRETQAGSLDVVQAQNCQRLQMDLIRKWPMRNMQGGWSVAAITGKAHRQQPKKKPVRQWGRQWGQWGQGGQGVGGHWGQDPTSALCENPWAKL